MINKLLIHFNDQTSHFQIAGTKIFLLKATSEIDLDLFDILKYNEILFKRCSHSKTNHKEKSDKASLLCDSLSVAFESIVTNFKNLLHNLHHYKVDESTQVLVTAII